MYWFTAVSTNSNFELFRSTTNWSISANEKSLILRIRSKAKVNNGTEGTRRVVMLCRSSTRTWSKCSRSSAIQSETSTLYPFRSFTFLIVTLAFCRTFAYAHNTKRYLYCPRTMCTLDCSHLLCGTAMCTRCKSWGVNSIQFLCLITYFFYNAYWTCMSVCMPIAYII